MIQLSIVLIEKSKTFGFMGDTNMLQAVIFEFYGTSTC